MLDVFTCDSRTLVGQLDERVNDLANHPHPRVIILQGASGIGKTWTIQELYAHLRTSTQDKYWPDLEQAQYRLGTGLDPMPTRKEVRPSLENFVWPANVLPAFGWWGFNCERLNNGQFFDVVGAIKPQLDAHLLPLTMAYQFESTVWERLSQKQRDYYLEIRSALLDEATGAAAERLAELIGAAGLPFIGTLTQWGVRGFKYLNQARLDNKALKTDVSLNIRAQQRRESAGRQLAATICALAKPELPAIAAIEDMHLMGPETAAMLDEFIRLDKPVLIIGTAWPEYDLDSHYGQWLAGEPARTNCQIINVAGLGDDELVSIIKEYAPATDHHTALRVIERTHHNPHFLKLALSSWNVARHITANRGRILDPEIALPRDINQLYQDRWRSLSEETRHALCCAVAINPTTDPSCRFPPQIVTQTSAKIQIQSSEKTAQGLAEAINPAGWCRLDASTELFAEEVLAQQVREAIPHILDETTILAAKRATKDILSDWIKTHTVGTRLAPSQLASTIASWYLGLSDENNPQQARVRAIAHYTLAHAADDNTNIQLAIDQAEQTLAARGRAGLAKNEQDVEINDWYADRLLEAGQLERSLKQRAKTLDMRLELGEKSSQLLGALYELANDFFDAAYYLQAAKYFGKTARFDDSGWGILAINCLYRQGLALHDAGEAKQAIKVQRLAASRAEIALKMCGSTLVTGGEPQSYTFFNQHSNVAKKDIKDIEEHYLQILLQINRCLTELNQQTKAISAIRELIDLADQYVEPTSIVYSDARRILRNALFSTKQYGEAAEVAQWLVDWESGQKPHDTFQLTSDIDSLIQCYLKLERYGEAVAICQDAINFLKPGDQGYEYFVSRITSRLGQGLVALGKVNEGLAKLRAGVDLAEKLLGSRSRQTYNSHLLLLEELEKVGDQTEIIDEYEKILAIAEQCFTATGQETIRTLHNYAVYLFNVGSYERAALVFQTLAERNSVLHTSNSRQVYSALCWLGESLGRSGQLSQCVASYRTASNGRSQLLGTDHEATLAAKKALRYWQGKLQENTDN